MTRIHAEFMRTSIASLSGVVLGLSISSPSWADVPAGVVWAAVGAAVTAALSYRRPVPVVMLAYLVVFALTVMLADATGSAWAAATWIPLMLAVFLVGRSSASFVLALTATVLVIDAPTIVVLSQIFGSEGTSGSFQYFMGFAGVVAAPMWLKVAISPGRYRGSRVLGAVAVIVTALAVWSVGASGSRSALLGLVVALAVSFFGMAAPAVRRQLAWKRVILTVAIVGLLVPSIDFALGLGFGSGQSTAAANASDSLTVTATEVQDESRALGGVRLALWRQAAVAVLAKPLGHGPGSFGHVNHAYQNEPLLWSGSPHSVWALAAVETGLPGVLALLAIVLGGLYVAARRRSPAMPALLGATAVMSLDVFASMPVQGLLWWAVIGTAWGPAAQARGGSDRWLNVVVVAGVVALAVYMSVRLSMPCGDGCDPIARYGGHPRLAGAPSVVIGDDPDDPRWAEWRERYPLAFWLAHAETAARADHDPAAWLGSLRAYPFQSAQTYVVVADAFAGQPMSENIAACGLVRFFDGRTIYGDWRAQGTELDDQRAALLERAGAVDMTEAACERAGIPSVAIGLQ